MEQVSQEVVRRLGYDAERLESLPGKIFEVCSDDNFGSSNHCRGRDMPVLGIVEHRVDERFIARHNGVGKSLT